MFSYQEYFIQRKYQISCISYFTKNTLIDYNINDRIYLYENELEALTCISITWVTKNVLITSEVCTE